MGLSIKDALNIAIKMEEDGREFYDFAAKNTSNAQAAEVFNALGKEELIHKDVFTKMANEAPDSKDITGESEEHLNFLTEHFNSRHVFNRDEFLAEKDSMDSIVKALEFAMDREHEAVVYYTAVLAAVNEEDQKLVQRIVKEESNHFVKLMHAKKLIIGK